MLELSNEFKVWILNDVPHHMTYYLKLYDISFNVYLTLGVLSLERSICQVQCHIICYQKFGIQFVTPSIIHIYKKGSFYNSNFFYHY